MMEIKGGNGAFPASGSGYSAEPEPEVVSAVPVSIPNALRQALGGLVSMCADQRDVYPDDATAIEAITETVNEIYACVEDGVFGRVAADPFPLADEALDEAFRRFPEGTHGALTFLWGASGLGFRNPTQEDLERARKRWGDRAAAIATEAGTATTVKQGVVHEGADPKGIAQKASQ